MSIFKGSKEEHAASLKRLTTVHAAYASAVDRLEELEAAVEDAEHRLQDATAAQALGEKGADTTGAVQTARGRVEEQKSTVQGLHKRLSTAAAEELRLRSPALEADIAAAEKAGRGLQKQVEDLAAQLERAQQAVTANAAECGAIRGRKIEAEKVALTKIRVIEGTVDAVEEALTDPTCIIDRTAARKAIVVWRAGNSEFSNLHLTASGNNPSMAVGRPSTVAIIYDETGRIIESLAFDFRDVHGNAMGGPKRNLCNLKQIVQQLDMAAQVPTAVG